MTMQHAILSIDGTQWADSPESILDLIPVVWVREHTAYDTSRHRLFTASDLQEKLTALGWPEGDQVDTRDDTPPYIRVVLALTDVELKALRERIDAETAGTITIDDDEEYAVARPTGESADEHVNMAAVPLFVSVPRLITGLGTLHRQKDAPDAAPYNAAIDATLAFLLAQPVAPVHLVTHADMQTLEHVLHTCRQMLIVGENDMLPAEEAAFEIDLKRMYAVTKAYLGITDEEDADTDASMEAA